MVEGIVKIRTGLEKVKGFIYLPSQRWGAGGHNMEPKVSKWNNY